MKCVRCSKEAYCSGFCEKHFQSYFEIKIRRTIKKYQLIEPGDNIAVALSGGKDSTVCLYVLKILGYNPTALTIKTGNEPFEKLENFCKEHEVPLKVVDFKEIYGVHYCLIKDVLDKRGFSGCVVNSVLIRDLMNKYGQEFDKIATGHNLDDEAENILMSLFKNDARMFRLGPKTNKLDGYVPRIKPLYEMSVEEILKYARMKGFDVPDKTKCGPDSIRCEVGGLIKEYKKRHPNVVYNIVKMYSRIKPVERDEGNICPMCGKACTSEICRACQIMLKLKEK